MSIILFMTCIGLLQADIVTNSFYKIGDCGAASVAPAFVGKVKSRSRIYCFTECSKIFACDSVIYQSSTKICLFYGANEGTCPSKNGRKVDVYKKNTVNTDGSLSSDLPTTSYPNSSSSKQIGNESTQTLQSNGTQNLKTDVSTLSSTQTSSHSSTITSAITCVHGDYYMDDGRYMCICKDGFMGTDCRERFTSCTDWSDYLSTLNNWDVRINYYSTHMSRYSRQPVTIQPPNSPQPFSVECQSYSVMTETYIYINKDKVRNTFDESWSKMKEGFVFDGGFWIGLDHLYELITNERSFSEQTMRVTWFESSLGRYSTITLNYLQIGNETTKYQLHYTDGKLNYISPFPDLKDAMFSAKDEDNDGVPDINCANKNKRAFWYKGECSFDTFILTHIKITKTAFSSWNEAISSN